MFALCDEVNGGSYWSTREEEIAKQEDLVGLRSHVRGVSRLILTIGVK